jgi:TonB family protein
MNPAWCKAQVLPGAVKLCCEGISSVDRGNFEIGISQLEDALKISPDYETAIAYLSNAHNREGARVDSNPTAALHEFCTALFYDGTNEKALVNSKNMIRKLGKNPDLVSDRLELSDQAMTNKDYIASVIECESALALKEDAEVRKKLVDVSQLAGPRPHAIHQPDWKLYMSTLQQKIKSCWKAPKNFLSQRLTVLFEVDSAGAISKLRLLTPSGSRSLDRSAFEAVESAAPFDPLPPGIGNHVNIEFTFDHNTYGAAPALHSPEQLQNFYQQGEETLLKSDLAQCEIDNQHPELLVQAILSLASFYANSGREKDAEPLLVRAQALQDQNKPTPSLPDTLNDLADVYCKQGRYELAEPLLKQSIKLCEENAQLGLFKLFRALTLYAQLLIQTNHADQSKQFLDRADGLIHQQRRSIEDYDKAISLDPKDAVNYFLRGSLYCDRHDWPHALQDFDQAIELNPRYAYAFVLRAHVNQQLKNEGDVLKDIEKAKEIDPTFESVYRASAAAHGRFKQWDLAISDLDKAIALDSKSEVAFKARGDAYKELKDYQHAMKDFDQALQLQPQDQAVHISRGLVCLSLKQYQQALKDFELAVKLKPDSAMAYSGLGLTYSDLKNYAKAVECLDNCIRLDPTQKNAYLNRGYAYGRLGQFERAIEDFNEAIKLNPDSVINYGDRSWAYYCLQNYRSAYEDGDKAVQLDPASATGYLNRGRASLKLGHYDSALNDLNKSIAIQANLFNGKAFYYRALVHEKLCHPELAEQDSAKAKFLGFEASKGEE